MVQRLTRNQRRGHPRSPGSGLGTGRTAVALSSTEPTVVEERPHLRHPSTTEPPCTVSSAAEFHRGPSYLTAVGNTLTEPTNTNCGKRWNGLGTDGQGINRVIYSANDGTNGIDKTISTLEVATLTSQ